MIAADTRLQFSKSKDTVGSSMNPTWMAISNSDGAGIISFIHSLMQLRPQALPFRCATIFSYLCVVVALFGTAMALRADLVGGGALIAGRSLVVMIGPTLLFMSIHFYVSREHPTNPNV